MGNQKQGTKTSSKVKKLAEQEVNKANPNEQLDVNTAKFDEQAKQLEANKVKLGEQAKQLGTNKVKLDEQAKQLEANKVKLDDLAKQLKKQKSTLDTGKKSLEAQNRKLLANKKVLEGQKDQIETNKNLLEKQSAKIEGGKALAVSKLIEKARQTIFGHGKFKGYGTDKKMFIAGDGVIFTEERKGYGQKHAESKKVDLFQIITKGEEVELQAT